VKKFFVTILAVFYLGVSSGTSLQFHFCMGKLVEWGLHTEKSEKCGKCGMKKAAAKKCCKTSQTELKAEKSHKVSSNDTSLQVFAPLLSESVNPFSNQRVVSELTVLNLPFSNAPPGLSSTPVFILNCNFRI
jgi:hypothetical protein